MILMHAQFCKEVLSLSDEQILYTNGEFFVDSPGSCATDLASAIAQSMDALDRKQELRGLGPSYVFIPLVLGPLNSLKTSRGYGWRIHYGVEVTELSTNKQHTLSETQQRQERDATTGTDIPCRRLEARAFKAHELAMPAGVETQVHTKGPHQSPV
jgi:hypothetical protein